MAKLGEVCAINPKGQKFSDEFEVSFIPMQNVSEDGVVDSSQVKTYSEVKKGFTYFEEDDVLFAKITPCMENGKGGIAKNLKNGIGFGSTEFHVLRPNIEFISSRWLYYLTSWDAFRKVCERNMTGSAGQKRVPKAFLENYSIELPSLSEQAKMERTLDNITNLISKRHYQLEKMDELVKSRFIEMFGDPVSNPKGWEKVSLSDIAELKIGPFGSLLHKEDYCVHQHPVINPSHIVDGKIMVDNNLTVTNDKYEELYAYHLKIGDVVLGRRGAMGRCAVVESDNMLCGTGSLLIRPFGELRADFIQKIISFPTFKKTIEDMAVGQTMPNLNVPIVSNFQIIKPPIEVQASYYDFVAQVDKSKLAVQKSLEQLEILKKSLMQAYFG